MLSTQTQMSFTGERFVPWLQGSIAYEHLHRYEAVRASCVGKRVLDVASGEGYGSAMLAAVATSVVGVDVDTESIEHARAAYLRANLRFETADAIALPLEPTSIDVIVCFETLEHLSDHAALLDGFVRVLAPGGLLVISSPNKAVYSDEAEYENPFHVHELYHDEFDALLRARFANVEIYGQQLVTVSLLSPIDAARTSRVDWRTRGDASEIVDPTYFVALCSNSGGLPDVTTSFFDAKNLLHRDATIEHEATKRRVKELENAHAWQASIAASDASNVARTIDPSLEKRRVVVASTFKAGAEFCANRIGAFLAAESPDLAYDRYAEHNLTADLLAQLRDRPFAINLQMKPHDTNLVACRDARIITSVLWRNLGDAVMSFDDNAKRYGVSNSIFYVDQESYASTPPQKRFRFVIDSLVPWSVGFYLAWSRLPGTVLHPYERLVDDTFSYLRTMIWMMGVELDDERLAGVLADAKRPPFRDAARFPTLLDEANRRRLERMLLDHPEAEQLEVLLWELPWEPLELKRRSPYDGSVLLVADGTTWFVSSGVRREVGAAWLASRGPERLRNPMGVTDETLAAIPLKGELR